MINSVYHGVDGKSSAKFAISSFSIKDFYDSPLFSELDDEKKNKLLKYINQDIQTIITTTDLKNIDDSIIKNSKLFKINEGIIEIEEVEEDGK